MRSQLGCTPLRVLVTAAALAVPPLACGSAGDGASDTAGDAIAEASSGSCPVVITIPSQNEAVGQAIQLYVVQTCAGWTNAMRAYIDDVDCGSSGYPYPNAGCDTTGGAQDFSSSTWVRVAPGKHTLVVNNWDAAGAVSVSSPITFTYTPATSDAGGIDAGGSVDAGREGGSDGGNDGGGVTGNDPVLVGAGDIAYWGGGASATGKELQTLVANNPGAMVFTLGDNAYGSSKCDEGGSPTDFSTNYTPTAWNTLLSKTLPTPGNHEYNNCDLSNTVGPCMPSQGCGTLDGSSWVMNGYWKFFDGHAAVKPGGGTATTLHYSYDFTTTGGKKWHYVALDSGMCFYTNNCAKGTSEYGWLASDLAAHTKGSYDGGAYAGIVVGTHIDRWDSAGCPGGSGWMGDMFDLAYTYKVDLWLDGHVHGYERFGQLGQGCQSGETASGCGTFCGPKMDANGPVLIDLGSGGADDWSGITAHPLPGSIKRIASTYAVGRVRMHDASWDFTLYDTSDNVLDGPVTYAVH